MADCELLSTCPFFGGRMLSAPVMSEMLKKRYCRGNKTICARYRVFIKLGRSAVPVDLFPNQQERADRLLK